MNVAFVKGQEKMELEKLKTKIARIERYRYIGMYDVFSRLFGELAKEIGICGECSGRGKNLIDKHCHTCDTCKGKGFVGKKEKNNPSKLGT